ncbi:MAG: pyridoxamine 5'-phosphate oxidase [Cytophagales bacterium]|nr:pyridoxamine 5'-phosphate oxidase [Cytophagales bacterium]
MTNYRSILQLLKIYLKNTNLNKKNIDQDPIKQFNKWLSVAKKTSMIHPEAMTLATSTKDGKPSVRILLLKGVIDSKFIFFTNYQSSKAKEIEVNPYGALLFYWEKLERQVRIKGKIEKIAEKESEDYFKTRPNGSKLGAWASPQSEVIPDRTFLEKNFKEFEEKYKNEEIPRPQYWGGYQLIPSMLEFWQGKPNRLHDRIRYRLENDKWIIERLAP